MDAPPWLQLTLNNPLTESTAHATTILHTVAFDMRQSGMECLPSECQTEKQFQIVALKRGILKTHRLFF